MKLLPNFGGSGPLAPEVKQRLMLWTEIVQFANRIQNGLAFCNILSDFVGRIFVRPKPESLSKIAAVFCCCLRERKLPQFTKEVAIQASGLLSRRHGHQLITAFALSVEPRRVVIRVKKLLAKTNRTPTHADLHN